MNMRQGKTLQKRCKRQVFVIILLGWVGLVGCTPTSPAPVRAFSTADLLIDASLLPSGWQVEMGPTQFSTDALGFRDNLGGSIISFRNSADADHIVARFQNEQAAALAYSDHDYTRDTQGRYGTTWQALIGFTYQSQIADQFRIMCATTRNVPHIGARCVIEAQYAEFLSVVLYSTLESERALGDLESLARAVDIRMKHYLGD